LIALVSVQPDFFCRGLQAKSQIRPRQQNQLPRRQKKSNCQHHPKTFWLRLYVFGFSALRPSFNIHREHSKHRFQKHPNQATTPQTPLRRMGNPKSLPLPRTPMTHRMMKSPPVFRPARRGRAKKVVILPILQTTRARQIRMGTRAPRYKMFSLPKVSY
jgi:hypothetical protein